MKLWALYLSCLMVVIPGTLGNSQAGEGDDMPPEIETTFEGDILVRPEDFADEPLADPDKLWPRGIVEFKFYLTFDPALRTLMRKAMDYITKLIPCVTFKPATSSSPNYVTIYPHGKDCKSELGMRGGEQAMYFNAACFRQGLIVPVHELMHTLGFVHEHNRHDRDDFIRVNEANIDPNLRNNFVKRPYGDAGLHTAGSVDPKHTPYDVLSVLHYGPLEGSKDGEAKVLTYLDALPDQTWQEPNQEDPLSLVDKVEASLAYNCENFLTFKDLLQYVHRNRNNNARRIKTMGRNMGKRIAEQDKKIAEQGQKIAEQDQKIAEQDKNMADIAKNVELIQSTVTAHLPSPQDSLLFITGGTSNSYTLSTTEIYPRSSRCAPPSLPSSIASHTTFITSKPNALVATCGGYKKGGGIASCYVLDPINQRWDESRMGSLTMARYYGAAVTLDHIGVFIVGGGTSNNAGTSEFLAAGQMQWQEGPALPVAMTNPCAMAITPNSFLAIHETDIREFDVSVAGPTGSEGWQESGRWPALKISRTNHPGCAKIGQKVIIAGGYNGGVLSSTEVLDLTNRRITSGGEMATPRHYFLVGTIRSRDQEQLFAIAGDGGSGRLNTVDEWEESSSSWKPAANLVEKRHIFGLVTVPRHLVCPI